MKPVFVFIAGAAVAVALAAGFFGLVAGGAWVLDRFVSPEHAPIVIIGVIIGLIGGVAAVTEYGWS